MKNTGSVSFSSKEHEAASEVVRLISSIFMCNFLQLLFGVTSFPHLRAEDHELMESLLELIAFGWGRGVKRKAVIIQLSSNNSVKQNVTFLLHLQSFSETQMKRNKMKQTQCDPLHVLHTCYIKLNLQSDLVGERCISEKLVGFFQRPIFCGDSID